MESVWSRVDEHIGATIVDEDRVLADTLRRNAEAGLRPIDVSAAQGKFLNLLERMSGARRVLEIGTLGGYSTIWMARALPNDGSLVTLESDPRHAEVAARNIAAAGLADIVEVRVGMAADTLPMLAAAAGAPFDFVFIDADKPSNTIYLDWAVRLGRTGTVIVLDNVVRGGELANAESRDPNVVGSRAALEYMRGHPRLSGTALQTVGSKGYDGFALMVVA